MFSTGDIDIAAYLVSQGHQVKSEIIERGVGRNTLLFVFEDVHDSNPVALYNEFSQSRQALFQSTVREMVALLRTVRNGNRGADSPLRPTRVPVPRGPLGDALEKIQDDILP